MTKRSERSSLLPKERRPHALNITADDADMFAVATLSSAWLREQWPQIVQEGWCIVPLQRVGRRRRAHPVRLGPLPSPTLVQGSVLLAGREYLKGMALRVLLNPAEKGGSDPSEFVAPDGSSYRATALRTQNGSNESIAAVFADVQPEWSPAGPAFSKPQSLRTRRFYALAWAPAERMLQWNWPSVGSGTSHLLIATGFRSAMSCAIPAGFHR